MTQLYTLPVTAANILTDATIPELPDHYRGKVRDNYSLPGGRRILIASDRLSAFDANITAIPFKGQALTQIARFWFERTGDICPNHVLDYPDPNVVVGRSLQMMQVEIVVRGYLAGTTSTSILTAYKRGERRMYGFTFPDGLRDNEKLPTPIITPTSKGDHGTHDEPLAAEDVIAKGLLTKDQWDEVSVYGLALFARGQDLAARQGLILADTKYEFGFDDTGAIVLADEIHTPDSSRYWMAASYPERLAAGEKPDSLDKDFIRNWVVARCDPYKDTIPDVPWTWCSKPLRFTSKPSRPSQAHPFHIPISTCRFWSGFTPISRRIFRSEPDRFARRPRERSSRLAAIGQHIGEAATVLLAAGTVV